MIIYIPNFICSNEGLKVDSILNATGIFRNYNNLFTINVVLNICNRFWDPAKPISKYIRLRDPVKILFVTLYKIYIYIYIYAREYGLLVATEAQESQAGS